jgi:hypothetical protein
MYFERLHVCDQPYVYAESIARRKMQFSADYNKLNHVTKSVYSKEGNGKEPKIE